MYSEVKLLHVFNPKLIIIVMLLTMVTFVPASLLAAGEGNIIETPIEGCWLDSDFDGYGDPSAPVSCDSDGAVRNDEDCHDGDREVYPGAIELWYDGIDQDCDGFNDYDQDYDGYVATQFSAWAGGTAPSGGDCDDENPDVNPGAEDRPDDGLDQNCNGVDSISCFLDFDEDGFGTGAGTVVFADDGVCDTNEGESDNDQDCDDHDVRTYPGAVDFPGDGVDQDCNGVDSRTCYLDRDRDGYGGQSTVTADDGSCDAVDGEYDSVLDCNDNVGLISPGAIEIWYDGIDQNCDLLNDYDQDMDTYVSSQFGDNVGGTAPNAGDCDDTDADIHPTATEIPGNDLDEDCDGVDLPLRIFIDGFEEDP